VRVTDEEIGAALEAVSVPALIASVVHLTGDPSILRGPIRPRRFINNEFQGAMTDDELSALRQAAFTAVVAWRDAGAPDPDVPPEPVLRELMDWIACEHVPDDYAAMFLEEMDLAGTDPRRLSVEEPDRISVVVVGAGMSGLLAGVRLKQAGIPFEIIEKNDDAGGTWYENTYPGCRVDVANHYYCYSFEPNAEFTELFCQQPELHAYFLQVMERHGIAEHIRWRTEVERAEWDDAAQQWRVTTRSADGAREERSATAVIAAVGQLNRPYVPDIPGLDTFDGPVFHSARWEHDVDLTGKRVAMIGAGASGFQIAPAIAADVEQLVIFQRSLQWVSPNPRYRLPVHEGTRWAMRNLPAFARWYRFMLLWQSSGDRMLEVARVDPDWPDLPRSANARSATLRKVIVDWMTQQLDGDEDLVARLVPDYPPLGKRMLQDDGSWFRCLTRPNVELVSDDIVGVEGGGIVTADGRYDVDVIVLATGFHGNDFLVPIEVVGRHGRSLEETWAGRPAAFVGVSVPDFPNLFLMYGPGTNLAHAGSVIFQAECQMRYIGGCLELLAGNGGGSIEPTREAFDDYAERLQAALRETVWAHPSVEHSWYKAADGNVYVLSPWRLADYWSMTAAPDLDRHMVTPPKG
jgi:4-hydroxyacetophenone monooxygenase